MLSAFAYLGKNNPLLHLVNGQARADKILQHRSVMMSLRFKLREAVMALMFRII